MRVAIVFFCAAVTACAQQDQRPTASKPALAVADTSPAPVADSQPVAQSWAPDPLPARDWAVLCSVHDTSQILILDARSSVEVDSLNKSGDSGWIQGNGNNTSLFSRMIDVVPMSQLNVVPADTTSEVVVYYGAFLPKPIDHDGIDEAFLDKASTTFYFARGHWFRVGSSE
jgi:hypothetical protein